MIRCGCGREFGSKSQLGGHLRWCKTGGYEPVYDSKVCARCGEDKPADQFYRHRYKVRQRHGHLDAYCKPCHLARKRVKGKRKACTVCHVPKGLVAFRNGSDTCRMCAKVERVSRPSSFQWMTRPSYAEWIKLHHCTEEELYVIARALSRYGRSGHPSADAIIERHCGEETWKEGQPPRRAAVLRHATVLLANEQARLAAVGPLGRKQRKKAA